MPARLPRIIVTGASGLVGRNFLAAARDDFAIIGMARRAPHEVGIEEHPNLSWYQVDISRADRLERVAGLIAAEGQVDFVLHLASYYDFTYEENPEYQRSNVEGTRNVLDMAKSLGVKHFLFASSLAACEYRWRSDPLDETTAPDAKFAYARSKRVGEEMLAEYSQYFRGSVVRLAAVVTDWCEYAPLYVFLSTWLSRAWNARILGGKAQTSITYIHVRDLIKLFRSILDRSDALPDYAIYAASPDGTVTHRELYELAQRFYYGRIHPPILMPKALAAPGILVRDLLGRVRRRRPFERLWMLGYMDKQLRVNATRTRVALGWAPAERDHILHRMLYMIENMISHPEIWRGRNEAFFRRRDMRPNLIINEELENRKERVMAELEGRLFSPNRQSVYPRLQTMPREEVLRMLRVLLNLLFASIRVVNRSLLLNYIDERWLGLAQSGVEPAEFCELLGELDGILERLVEEIPRLEDLRQESHSFISLTLQLARDQVQVADEALRQEHLDTLPSSEAAPVGPLSAEATLPAPHIVDELRAQFQLAPETTLTLEDLRLLLSFLESKKRR